MGIPEVITKYKELSNTRQEIEDKTSSLVHQLMNDENSDEIKQIRADFVSHRYNSLYDKTFSSLYPFGGIKKHQREKLKHTEEYQQAFQKILDADADLPLLNGPAENWPEYYKKKLYDEMKKHVIKEHPQLYTEHAAIIKQIKSIEKELYELFRSEYTVELFWEKYRKQFNEAFKQYLTDSIINYTFSEKENEWDEFVDAYDLLDEEKRNETIYSIYATFEMEAPFDIFELFVDFIMQYGEFDESSRDVVKDYVSNETDTYVDWLFDLPRTDESIFALFTTEEIEELLHKNESFSEYDKIYKRKQQIQQSVLDHIPENYIDFYPTARQMSRKFIIHIGPTNSGKTYQSIQRLSHAKQGIYLAPLRLLAYEQYEKLNSIGVKCSLVTGEERELVENATVQSSTIEMLDIHTRYDVAVIDEAQMIDDPERGGAWTQAILGILADEIHITASVNAKNVLVNLINECGDSYEVVEHTRNTELVFENDSFSYPNDVRKGDALIVFSRRDVHAVAAELRRKDYKCSVIYGKLPYKVRQSEANKFASGENDIVIATDAIGMGMNLPIQRVVFLKNEKFDGFMPRPLRTSEIKQIAGRAGRYGMFEKGYVNAWQGRASIKNGLITGDQQVQKAVLPFSKDFLQINESLSDIINAWIELKVSDNFQKQNMQHEYQLTKQIENETDDKKLLYELITIPFDERSDSLINMWRTLAMAHIHNKEIDFTEQLSLISPQKITDMEGLEFAYQKTDLLFNFYRIQHKIDKTLESTFYNIREEINKKIISLLEQSRFAKRKCRECGCALPWNYKYGMCQKCYNQTRRYYYDWY